MDNSVCKNLTDTIVCAFSEGKNVCWAVYHAYLACMKDGRNEVASVKLGLMQAAHVCDDESRFMEIALRVGKGLQYPRYREWGFDGYDMMVLDAWKAECKRRERIRLEEIERACKPGHGSIYLAAKAHFEELAGSMHG